MKKSGLFLAVIILLIISSCQQSIDYEKEKQAIIEVVNGETEAYMDFDFEKLMSYYVKDSLNFRLSAGADNHVFLEGWDEIEAFFRDELVDNDPKLPKNLHVKVAKDNYRIKVYEKSAYVICTETWTYTKPNDVIKINSRQVRFLEKVDDEWKIAFLSFIGTSGYEEEIELQEMGVGFNRVN